MKRIYKRKFIIKGVVRSLLVATVLLPLMSGSLLAGHGYGGGGHGGGGGSGSSGSGGGGTDAAAGEAFFRANCTGCHTFGHGDHLGPDLTNRHRAGWSWRFLRNPGEALASTMYGQRLYAQWGYVMPNFNLTEQQIDNIEAFLAAQDEIGPLSFTPPAVLSGAEFEEAKDLYFNRCAGCHGLYRTGATGPEIGEQRAEWIGTDGLGAMLRVGTPRGMPNFGQSEILSEDDITKLASFLQDPPPAAPDLPMSEIQASWELLVPVADRPTTPQTSRDWQNFFGVVLRDEGKIAIFDGDSQEEIARVDVGFAVHILRSSASGRYFYAIGRDGVVTLIDLWASTPNVVARVKGCHDARSVDGSKFEGYEDQYLIEGCYWPPQYVTYDGLTLEPHHRVDLPMTSIGGEVLLENRVAAIVASEHAPVWVINQKESGYVGIVDYSQEGAPLVANIPAERFLHDGGWDHSKRYFITAANASNKMVVVDAVTQSLVTSFSVGGVPHPGRGANWLDPVYGWVNATPHIGSAFISVYGADPENHPEHAWQVIREIPLPAAGSLFIKTHPNSPWVLVDMAMSTTNDKQICAIDKATATVDRCFNVAQNGKAVHFEFNRDGSEVWVSDWDSDGSVVVLDGQTLSEIKRVSLPTPTGKFNVYNTAQDVY